MHKFIRCKCPISDIDDCSYYDYSIEDYTNPCENGATCIDDVASYTCECMTGYRGENCEEIDDCESNPCQNGATCYDGDSSYTCNCMIGYTGMNCETSKKDIHLW